MFETLAISSKLKTRITSVGRKTINLVRKTGNSVLEFPSNLKRTIKEKQGIKTALTLSIFLAGTSSISNIYRITYDCRFFNYTRNGKFIRIVSSW